MNQLVKKQADATPASQEESPSKQRFRLPPVDISECESEYLIEADMPGTKEENIDVQYHQGELTISGKACRCEENERKSYRFRQFESMDFYRAFRIGESVDAEKISAHYHDGVLTVHLPKAEALKPRKIEVSRKA